MIDRDMSVGLGGMPRKVYTDGGYSTIIIVSTVVVSVALCFLSQEKGTKLFHPFEKTKLT